MKSRVHSSWPCCSSGPRFFGLRATVCPKQRGSKTGRPALLDGLITMTLSMGVKWASGGYFDEIDPRELGLKGVVMGLFLQTKGVLRIKI